MKTRSTWAVAAAALCLAGSAQAALVTLGDGSVLDTETRLVWLEDWGLRSFQSWATQTSWAENLTVAGSSDWHLPTIEQYATLYAGLERDGLTPPSRFADVLPSAYWSSTDDPLSPTGAFWFFADTGLQVSASKDFGGYATAVRIYSPIPEPSSFALTALGLLAAGTGSPSPVSPRRRNARVYDWRALPQLDRSRHGAGQAGRHARRRAALAETRVAV